MPPPFTSTHLYGGEEPEPQPEHRAGTQSKWSKRFFADLAERVASTFIGALLTYVTVDNVLERAGFDELWAILVLPTLVSLLKGLAANLGNSETGASLLPTAPPGPEVNPDADWEDEH